jgi:uncharacterized membrane protein YraQ (UPF0718 family)
MFRAPIRACLALACIVVLAFSFGYFSRYPDLNRKAMMAQDASVADTISMYPIMIVKADDAFWTKVGKTTVNWTHDNRRGMAFGITLGALFLALFRYISLQPVRSRFGNSALGMLIGTPLGVCVNCAAPVFKGALRSRKIELAIALMLSSPTLNIVVVTMVFSLFPFYIAVSKIAFNLAMILLLVPWMASRLDKVTIRDFARLPQAEAQELEYSDLDPKENFFRALFGFVIDFFKSLWTIFIRTAPWMLVAGFLGALLSYAIPLDGLRGSVNILTIVLTTIVGLILPVPMAFDIVLTNALYSAGLPLPLAFALLLGLGSFSLYSFVITWKSAAPQWALGLTAAFFVLITAASVTIPHLHEVFYIQPNIDTYKELTQIPKNVESSSELAAKPIPGAPPFTWQGVSSQNPALSIESTAFLPRTEVSGKLSALEGPDIGLDLGFVYTVRDYPDPFWVGRGTAAGDFDKDGWIDLVFGSDQGPIVYKNIGGRFARIDLNQSWLKQQRVYAVALVDMDNDGWLDLYLTTFNQGNFVLLNEKGKLGPGTLIPIPNGKGILTVSPSLGDLDQDGDLDVLNGNMALGINTGLRSYGEGRQSFVTWNQGSLQFQATEVPGPDGEAMASLISDITNDGRPDLYICQDFLVPDRLVIGTEQGLQRLSGPAIANFGMPLFSMGVDTGDINNDLKLDLLVTGTMAASQNLTETIDGVPASTFKKNKSAPEDCAMIRDPFYRGSCESSRKARQAVPFHNAKSVQVKDCLVLPEGESRDQCLLTIMWTIVTENVNQSGKNDPKDLDCSPYDFDKTIEEVCLLKRRAGENYTSTTFEGQGKQVDTAVLYLATPDGGLQPAGKELFKHPGGWTWSSKFADIDGDGWQDILNAEGAVSRNDFGWNVLMHNQQGKGFEQRQFSWGFRNDFNLFSFVFIDFDRDGDLDVIGNASEGPIQVYRNDLTRNHEISLALEFTDDNFFGIGSKVILETEQGPQIREIKAGGGYQSFDAPELHFGLGSADSIKGLTIISPKGRRYELKQKLPADRIYRLRVKAG